MKRDSVGFVSQEKQEEGVKNQFVTSIADAKERIKKFRGVLGQNHTEVSFRVTPAPAPRTTRQCSLNFHPEGTITNLLRMLLVQQYLAVS